ncbi:DUF4468 domain-containing protein [Winogradskyella ouciana]|uniref:DUF4468 domain-containing protein n=1 Tax=Winogradskyella ouciana TaxID=2608631 RepID=UPI003D2B19B5
MKNLIIIFTFLIIALTAFKSNSKELDYEEKTITGIYELEGKTKTEIFSAINKWIALNYNSAKNVVQLNDKESGTIIVKGINEAVYKNVMKEMYPKNKYMQEYNTVQFNHTIEINIKDNRYRIIYHLTDIITPTAVAGYNVEQQYSIVFDMIDFTGLKQEKIDAYNEYVDELWKKALVGKKKREKFKELTKPTFEELNKGVKESVIATMNSIVKTVKSTKKDDW